MLSSVSSDACCFAYSPTARKTRFTPNNERENTKLNGSETLSRIPLLREVLCAAVGEEISDRLAHSVSLQTGWKSFRPARGVGKIVLAPFIDHALEEFSRGAVLWPLREPLPAGLRGTIARVNGDLATQTAGGFAFFERITGK